MLKNAIAAATLTTCLTIPSLASSADGARYLDLAKCIAYATVKGGLDGKKDVPPEYAAVISLLGEEYMFEASALGLDDDQAHTFVVTELMRQNRVKEERGMETLTEEVGQTCSALADTLISANQP
jgi:hypothetical protein|nr:hypothetical protein [Neorhizobium tomejilense]